MFRRLTLRSLFRQVSFALIGWLSLLAGSASAVSVSNYSWLQLPAGDVTTVLGSTNNVTGTSFGDPVDFRWGDYVWLPTHAMTASGAQMYYASVRLDQARPVDSVRLQWYTTSMTRSRYYIDSSNDGSSWTNIATVGPAATPPDFTVDTVSVIPGNYQYIRARFEPGDYTSAGYGGPGLMLLDPRGSGTLDSDQVNWANAAHFGTTITNTNMPTYNSTSYNDGTLADRSGTPFWTGTPGSWPGGTYTTIDLGANRLLNSATAVWGSPYSGSDFDVEYSTDGTNFFAVSNPQAPVNYSPYSSIGATKVGFDPTIARYIRMSGAVNFSGGFTLMNQMLLHGPTDGVLATDPLANDTIAVAFRKLPETVTLNGAIELENIGTSGTSIGVLSYQITGPDALRFNLTNFSPTILGSGNSVLFNLQFMSLATENYNAVLTFNTTLGDVVFNLQATMVPEPSTFALLGLGLVGVAVKTRRRRQTA